MKIHSHNDEKTFERKELGQIFLSAADNSKRSSRLNFLILTLFIGSLTPYIY